MTRSRARRWGHSAERARVPPVPDFDRVKFPSPTHGSGMLLILINEIGVGFVICSTVPNNRRHPAAQRLRRESFFGGLYQKVVITR